MLSQGRLNCVREQLQSDQPIIGAVMQIGSPEIVEIAGKAGFDFVWIDCEHGSFDLAMTTSMLRAADAVGLTPVVRVASHDPNEIMKALDAGAMGVVIPQVSTAEQAAAAVAAARYRVNGNSGRRGACPFTRASWHRTDDWPQFVKWANENVMVWALIETLAGVEQIDAIVAVEGIDAIVLGPFDLAHDMGHLGEVRHPEVIAALENVAERARARGVEVMASVFSTTADEIAEERRAWASKGVRMFNLGMDRSFITEAMRYRVNAVQDSRPVLTEPPLCQFKSF